MTISMWIGYFVLMLLAIALHLRAEWQTLTRMRVVEIALLWCLVIGVGATGIVGFLGHTLNAGQIADAYGWASGDPLQQELGCACLAFGIMGVLCIWLRGNFWSAAVIGYTVFLFGTAGLRALAPSAYQAGLLVEGGIGLYFDIVLPIALLLLWIALMTLSRSEGSLG